MSNNPEDALTPDDFGNAEKNANYSFEIDASNKVPETDLFLPRYSNAKKIDKGTYGALYVADDVDLHRKVAIKKLHLDPQSPAQQSRFIRESEITGKLEHPNIVAVHGRGHCYDGSPYFVMRFIDGTTLEDRIWAFSYEFGHALRSDAAISALRVLLRSFIEVCGAVAHAHSWAIIHRDLKPKNVRIGLNNEVAVIDWGLARELGNNGIAESPHGPLVVETEISEGKTSAGQVKGTVYYMSPEQANGETDLDQRTDIYGLGAILYHLLTGQPPFATEKSIGLLLENIKRGKLTNPSGIRNAIPRPLEAVCLKAMAPNREDRFRKASEIAAEIERWMSGDALTCFPGTLRERLFRHLAKHQVIAVSLVLSLVFCVVGVGSYATFEASRHHEVSQINMELKNRNERIQAQATAIRESMVQTAEHADLVIQSCNHLIFTLHDQLGSIPRTQNFRRQLLKDAIATLEELLPNEGLRSKTTLMIAACHLRLGELELILGNVDNAERHFDLSLNSTSAFTEDQIHQLEAHWIRSSVFRGQGDAALKRNRLNDARDGYQSANEAALQLDPSRSQEALSLGYDRLGVVETLSGNPQVAQEHLDNARGRIQALLSHDRSNDQLRGILALNYEHNCQLDQNQGRYLIAQSNAQKSLDISQELLLTAPDDLRAKTCLAKAFLSLGSICLDRGRISEALPHLELALKHYSELASQDPDVFQLQFGLCLSNLELAKCNLRTTNIGSAHKLISESEQLLLRLSTYDTNNVGIASALRLSYEKLSDVMVSEGQTHKAIDLLQKSLQLAEHTPLVEPDLQSQINLSAIYVKLGDAMRIAGDLKNAGSHYSKGLSIRQGLFDKFPSDFRVRRLLAIAHQRTGYLALQHGQFVSAKEIFERVIKSQSDLETSERTDILHDIQSTKGLLGNALKEIGDIDGAGKAYRAGLEIALRLSKIDAQDLGAQRSLAIAYDKVADFELAVRHRAEARSYYLKALETKKKYSAIDNTNQSKRDLCVSYQRLGDFESANGDAAAAEAYFDQLLTLAKELAAADPHNSDAQFDYSVSHEKLGDIALHKKEFSKAIVRYEEAASIHRASIDLNGKSYRLSFAIVILATKAASVCRATGDRVKSVEFAERAIEEGEVLLTERPRNAELLLKLSQAREYHAEALEGLGESQRSLDSFVEHSLHLKAIAESGKLNDVTVYGAACSKVAGLFLKQRRYQESRAFQQLALAAFKKWTSASPDDEGASYAVAATYRNLGRLSLAEHKNSEAKDYFAAANSVVEEISQKRTIGKMLQDLESSLVKHISECEVAEKCIADIDFLFQQSPSEIPKLATLRVRTQLAMKASSEAIKTAERFAGWVEGLNADLNPQRYNAACLFAVCASEQKREREELTDASINLLIKCKEAGYFNEETVAHFDRDSDFDSVRDVPQFKDFVKLLEPPNRAGLECGLSS